MSRLREVVEGECEQTPGGVEGGGDWRAAVHGVAESWTQLSGGATGITTATPRFVAFA